MLSVVFAVVAIALNAWASEDELVHRAYLWVDGKSVKVEGGKAAPLAVWGLTAPLFVDRKETPTPANPLSLRFSMDDRDVLERLAASKQPFLLEVHVLGSSKGALAIKRVVRLQDAKIETLFKVMPGHGREGGLANRPYVSLSVSARSVEAGPPDRVKPSGG